MRDWSKLLHTISQLSYDEIVQKGRKTADTVLDILAKYSDIDSAPITLAGLAAYTATVDDELSEIEVKLIGEIIGISEKEFKLFIHQIRQDNSLITELTNISDCMNKEEMDELSTLLALIFAVDGKITQEEKDFIKKLCA